MLTRIFPILLALLVFLGLSMAPWGINCPFHGFIKPAYADEQSDEEKMKKLNHIFTYYYIQPRPDKVVEFAEVISRVSEKNPKGYGGLFMAVALTQIFKQSEAKLKEWEPSFLKLSKHGRLFVGYALWWSGTKTGRQIIEAWAKTPENREVAEAVMAKPVLDMHTAPIIGPVQVHLLWGAFVASGDTKFVDRVIELLSNLKKPDLAGKTEAQQKEAERRFYTARFALATLTKYGIAHQRVYDRLKFYANSPDQTIRDAVAGIIPEIEKYRHELIPGTPPAN